MLSYTGKNLLGCRQAVRLRTLTPSSGSSNLSTPAKIKEQASACSFIFTCELLKERFELRATARRAEKTCRWQVFSDDRRHLQSISSPFCFCFANIKKQISPPQPNKTRQVSSCRVFCFSYRKFKEKFKLRAPPAGVEWTIASFFLQFSTAFLCIFWQKFLCSLKN